MTSSRPTPPSPAKAAATPIGMNAMMTTKTTTTTTTMMMPSRAPSSTISTTSNASDTTSSGGRASGRPPRFVPPPPPPRRLLLTQTDPVAGQAKTWLLGGCRRRRQRFGPNRYRVKDNAINTEYQQLGVGGGPKTTVINDNRDLPAGGTQARLSHFISNSLEDGKADPPESAHPAPVAAEGHDLSTFHRLTGRDLLSRSATNRVQPKEAVISYSQQRNSKMDTPTVNRRPRPLSAGALGGSTSNSNPNNSRSSSSHGNSPLGGGLTRAGVEPVGHQQQVGQAGGGSAGRVGGGSGSAGGNSTACSSSRGGSKLGDLEILARREKIYSMSQSRSGCRVRETTSTTTLMAMATEMRSGMDSEKRDSSWPKRAAAAASLTRTRSSTSMDGAGAISTTTTTTTTMTEEAFLETEVGRSKRLINFIKRRNSEITASSTSSTPNFSDGAFGEQPQPSHSQGSLLLQKLPPGQSQAQDSVEMAQMSPRKDNDKPSLNRRLWKQITKRRRTNSVSQIVAG
ncbi:GD24611 [Drosophila simulans]|uniref:GD24611 n=1 Tax=Drosophila simulans TaxID=7240 RepID=B4NTY6_DROSI|nr:GD24611 [Drosophila simulans]